jgi:ethanolamine-phosphate cytidylyltransferase
VLVLSAGLLWWRFYSHRVRTRNEQRRALEAELSESLGNVKTLERKLLALESLVDSQHDGEYVRPIRVWMDGAFDMVHYGHMNAFRKVYIHPSVWK